MENLKTSGLIFSTVWTSLITSFSGKNIKLSNIRPSALAVYVMVICNTCIGTAQASIIPYDSLLEVEGRAYQGVTPIITTVTQTQGASTNTLIAEDSHAVTNAHATTNASATWLNAGQGTVNFSKVSMFLGSTTLATTVRNSGLFTYDFQADTDGLMSVDYNVASIASGVGAPGYLSTNAFSIFLTGSNGDRNNISLEQNSSGLFSADVVSGVDYQLMIIRYFIGSSTLNENNQILIDATQSANFNWQIPSADLVTVPVPASAWLMVSGLIGLFGVTRNRKLKRSL